MREPAPRPFLTAREIQARVRHLAARISRDYAKADELVMIGVLRGAFIFLADLSRRLSIPRRIDFIAVSSYGADATSPGAVRLVLDVRFDLKGRHVLVVEDIVDTGHTLKYLLDTLASRRPASLASCALVSKPSRREVDVPIDYLGFEIPDVWAVGYGLDYGDRFRTLPYIGAVEATGS